LVTRQGHAAPARPLRGPRDLARDVRRVPALLAVLLQSSARRVVVDGGEERRDYLRSRRVRDALQVRPDGGAPRRTLMRKVVRLVEVEVVDDVAIRERLYPQQLVDRRPARPRGDDGVLRRALADGRGE